MSDPFDPELSENRRWLSVADLLGAFTEAPLAVIGAPLNEGSITPGRCDLAPSAIRRALETVSAVSASTSRARVSNLGSSGLTMPNRQPFYRGRRGL